LRNMVKSHDSTFFAETDHIKRRIIADGAPKHLNVVVLLEESLGAEFVGAYGDRRGLTPNFDRLAPQGMLFTRAYATGTRTVRGMEAVSASFPPVPAESIVKRAHNEGMFNWSTVMAKNAGADPGKDLLKVMRGASCAAPNAASISNDAASFIAQPLSAAPRQHPIASHGRSPPPPHPRRLPIRWSVR